MAISLKSKPKAGTKSKAKAAPKRAQTKAAPKRTQAKAKPKAAAKAPAERTRRSPKTDLTQAQLKKHLGPLAKVANERVALNERWKAKVEESNERVLAALDAGVPIGLVVESAQISRQHCYKLIEQAQAGRRSNGNAKSARKPAAKATTKKPAAKAKTTSKRGGARIKAKA